MITVEVSQAKSHFKGPLDLLLQLVRQNQYPLHDVPIAEITRQYDSYLRQARDADVDLGGEFIEVASWLVLLKSRAMLPGRADEEPPAQEFERVLLDHTTMLATAGLLRNRMQPPRARSGQRARSHAVRQEPEQPAAEMPATPDKPTVPTVHDALLAARQALAVARAHVQVRAAHASERYSVEAVLCQLEARLASLGTSGGVSTEPWFRELPVKEARVSLLLALLELARLRRILVAQKVDFGRILLKKSGDRIAHTPE